MLRNVTGTIQPFINIIVYLKQLLPNYTAVHLYYQPGENALVPLMVKKNSTVHQNSIITVVMCLK